MSTLTLAPNRQFRDRVRRLHACGPRPVGELLSDILARLCPQCRDLVQEQVEHYSGMDPDLVRWLRADDWLDDRDLVRLVSGDRS
jgi:hypothetical protein